MVPCFSVHAFSFSIVTDMPVGVVAVTPINLSVHVIPSCHVVLWLVFQVI